MRLNDPYPDSDDEVDIRGNLFFRQDGAQGT
jgi:hypothetical protein